MPSSRPQHAARSSSIHPGRPNPCASDPRAAALAALALTLAVPQGASAAESTLTVLIGTASPMSGPQSELGQDSANGVRMAIADLNAQDLRIDGARVIWKVDVQDDQADPRQAAMIARRFVDERVAGVVGHVNSGATYPAMHVYAAAGLPVVVQGSTDPRLARQGWKDFFRMITDDGIVGGVLADYARETLHARRIAVIDDRTAYGQGLADAFVRAATAAGLQILTREYTSDKATDFSAVLTRIKPLKPDAIVYGGVYGQAGPMLVQIARLDVAPALLGGDAMCPPALAVLARAEVGMVHCAEGGSPLQRMPGGAGWKRRYDAVYGASAYQYYGPHAYDATMVLARAMLKAQSADPRRYLAYVRDIDLDGVTRKRIHFQADGNIADPVVTISRFVDGVKVPAEVREVGARVENAAAGAAPPRSGRPDG